MHITYFFRKSRPGAFSIERLFRFVQEQYPEEVSYTNHFLGAHSNGLWNRLKLVREAYSHQGEINHITGDVNFIALLMHRNKTVLTIHDIESLERKNRISNAFLKFLWITMPVARAKYITVVSETTKQKLLRATSVSPEKIVVIPNVISQEYRYQPKVFNEKEPVILQVGTKYNKNLERTIAALKGIACKLVVVGELSDLQKQQLVMLNINFINCVGISDEELRELYLQADIVSFVSLFEGFGMPILEAQATGRVVLTSNCSAMPEVAGEGALFVNPYSVDEMRSGFITLINNKALRESIIDKGLINSKRYRPTAVAQQYLNLYSKL